jgi:hypothetical protein
LNATKNWQDNSRKSQFVLDEDFLAFNFFLKGHVDIALLLDEAPIILGHEIADNSRALVVFLLVLEFLGDGLLELGGCRGEATCDLRTTLSSNFFVYNYVEINKNFAKI